MVAKTIQVENVDEHLPKLLRGADDESQCVRQMRNAVLGNDLDGIARLSKSAGRKLMTEMLWLAASSVVCNPETIIKLIDNGADVRDVDGTGRTLVHEAASWLNFAALEPLVKAGVPVDSEDHSLRTALIEVVNMRHTDKIGLYRTVKTLKGLNSDVGHTDKWRRDAAFYAKLNGNGGVSNLVEHNA